VPKNRISLYIFHVLPGNNYFVLWLKIIIITIIIINGDL